MDRLPESLLYMVSQIANYSKNTVKIQTLNQTSLSPSGGASQLRLSLPVNSLVNMKSLSFHGTFRTTGIQATESGGVTLANRVYALIPRGGLRSVIDRCSFSAGGIALDSSTAGYNVFSTVKENIEKSIAPYMSDDKVLNQSIIEPVKFATSGWEFDNVGQEKQLIMNNMLGFPACEPTYLDLNLLPEVFLTIQVTDASVLPVQYEGTVLGGEALVANPNFSGGGCSYQVNDIFFSMEVISIGNGIYSALQERVLSENGSLDVPYLNFNTFTTEQSSAGGTVRGGISTMSLDKVYAFQRNNDTTGVAPYEAYYVQQPPVACSGNTSFAFNNANQNFISSGISDFFFQINNAPYPLYRVGTIDAYNYAVASQDRQYTKERGSLIGSQETWLDNCWVAVQKLNHDQDPRLISGMNLSSVAAQLSFTCGSNNTASENWNRQAWLVTESTSMLRIGAGRSIAVIA